MPNYLKRGATALDAAAGGVTELFVPAAVFDTNGTPADYAQQMTLGPWGWRLAPTGTETIRAMVGIPPDWTSYASTICLTADSAGGGNAKLIMYVVQKNITYANVTDGLGTTLATVAMPAASAMTTATGPTSTVKSGAEFFDIHITRDGENGADTAAMDAVILGVLLTKV